MANIFKATLKKDVIADMANGKREVRFPITKFWATRFAEEYNLEEKTFVFKTFDSLEFSSPSNQKTGGETYEFNFDEILVDGDEFVLKFKDIVDIENEIVETQENESEKDVEESVSVSDDITTDNIVEETTDRISINDILETTADDILNEIENKVMEDIETFSVEPNISNDDVFTLLTDWFENEKILEKYYADSNVFATNAKQVIVLPKGRVLGFKKTLPVDNDVEVRIEFDTNERIYLDSVLNFNLFEDEIFNVLNEIRKNNFVFIWKRHTGIFMDSNGVYFGIKYSTRKSIGFNRKYNVQ